MNKIEQIKKIIEKNNGILYVKELEKNNIHRQYLKQLEATGYVKKVVKGMYTKNDKQLNEFFIAQQKYKTGIFSHNTALYFHNLTDRTPFKLDMTFPSNVRVNNEYINSHYIKKENHLLGVQRVQIKDGTTVLVYDLERTICDIIRDRNKIDIQIFNNAMKEYAKCKNRNLNLLYKYAKKFKIENILRQYMEVLDWKEM